MDNRLLVICLIFSLLLHLVLLKGLPFAWPKFEINTPIEVELKFLQPTPVSTTLKSPQVAKKIRPKPKSVLKPKPRLKPKSKPKPKLKAQLSISRRPLSIVKKQPIFNNGRHIASKSTPEIEEVPKIHLETSKTLAYVKVKPAHTSPPISKNRSQSFNAEEILQVYLNAIRLRIEQNKEYPLWARRRGVEGKAILVFLLKEDGHLANIKIEKSSGYPILDKAALKAVQKAAPFPPFPAKLKKKEITLKLPICFKLK